MPLSRVAQVCALLSTLGLIAALVWWCGAAVGALLGLPLILVAYGIARGRLYTASWASMLLVFYVAALLAEGVATPSRRSVAQILSAVAAFDFVSLVLFVRLTARERAGPGSRTESSAGAAR